MKRRSTWASRLTAVITALLSLLLFGRLAHETTTSAVVLVAALGVAGLAAAAKMWFHNCFESQLLASLVAGATLLGTLLSVTLGLPGADRSPVSVVHALLVLLPLAALVLLNTDGRLRRRDRGRTTTPYAP